MNIYKTINPIAEENTYYLENDSHLLLIDPGSDWETIQATVNRLNKPVAAILLTHTHYDHIMSLDLARDSFGHPPVYVSESEADWLFTPEMNLSGLARHADMENVICQPADHFFENHKTYQLSGFEFEVRPTPGHSIGGVSFVFDKEELAITGDALFSGSIGRTDLPTGDKEMLLHSIHTQLFTLPGHYRVFPGHREDTTIAHEKTFNPFFS